MMYDTHSCRRTIKDLDYVENEIKLEVQCGRWIPLKGWFNKSIVKCSVCGNTLDMNGVNAGRGDANFCPNCGADMREVNEDDGNKTD